MVVPRKYIQAGNRAFALLLLTLMIVSQASAQRQLEFVSGSVTFASVARHSVHDRTHDTTYPPFDSNYRAGISMSVYAPWHFTSNQYGTLCMFKYLDDSLWHAEWDLKFVLDAGAHRLRNIVVHSEHRSGYEIRNDPYRTEISDESQTDAQLSSATFRIVGDSVLIVSDSGIRCMAEFVAGSFRSAHTETTIAKDTYSTGNSDFSSDLGSDSTRYSCSLMFRITAPIDAVSSSSGATPRLNAALVPDGHTIRFLFPAAARERALQVFDILGRAIANEPIPGATSVASIRRAASGLYFARLGEMTTSFVVP